MWWRVYRVYFGRKDIFFIYLAVDIICMMFYQLIKFLFEQVSTKERFRDINMVTSYIMTTGHIFIFVGTFIIKVCLCYSLWKWVSYILMYYLHRRTQNPKYPTNFIAVTLFKLFFMSFASKIWNSSWSNYDYVINYFFQRVHFMLGIVLFCLLYIQVNCG